MSYHPFKIEERGTLVHRKTRVIYDYIKYEGEYFLCAILYNKPFDQQVTEINCGAMLGVQVNFSEPLDYLSVMGGTNYEGYKGIEAKDFVKKQIENN